MKSIPLVRKQGALFMPTGLLASAVMANVEVPAGRLSSISVPDDEEGWRMGDLVEADVDERVAVKCRLCDLLDTRCAKRQKVSKSVVEAVGVAVNLVDDTVVRSPGEDEVEDPHNDELTGRSASTMTEVVLLTT